MRQRLSFANVMSVVAVFIALGGGAYATTIAPRNSVRSSSIKDGEVRTKDVRDNALTGVDIDESKLARVPTAAAADRATSAVSADRATSATTADRATTAASADRATSATTADTALGVADNAITGPKVGANSLTGEDLDESTLGKVPSATSADTSTAATTANAVAADAVTGAGVDDDTLTGADVNESTLSGVPITPLSVVPGSFGTGFPAASVSSNLSQHDIPNGTSTIAFNTEDFDVGAVHDTSSNTSRLTAPIAGIYVVSGYVYWGNDSATGIRQIEISKGGNTTVAVSALVQTTTAFPQAVSGVVKLAASEFVTLKVMQSSGVQLRVLGTSNSAPPKFAMTWVGPAT